MRASPKSSPAGNRRGARRAAGDANRLCVLELTSGLDPPQLVAGPLSRHQGSSTVCPDKVGRQMTVRLVFNGHPL